MYNICSLPIIFLCASYVVCVLHSDANLKWSSRHKDSNNKALDEINDSKILAAVQSSMREWTIKSRNHQRKKRATKKVCYNDLGCFEDSGPFSYLEMLPSPPDEINTKFFFYSTKNRSDGPLFELPFLDIKIAMNRSSSQRNERNKSADNLKHFSKSSFTLDDLHGFDELSTRVIVHGFGSACPHVWIYEMKTALMAVENCIVICVDWENGATFPNYVRAAANTRLVGKQLAIMLNLLKEHKGLNLSKTHIIGFSLGAHVAGFAGAELPGLSRITGLDPAGPLFESQHPKVRLDSTDANFVDVIHSNGENLILGGLGSWQPMGHVDFYPNGGRVQTGCSNLFVGAVTDFIWSQAAELEGRSLCNHRRAYKFFIDSVAPRCLFPAFPCDSYDNFLKGKCFPCKQEPTVTENGMNNSRCGNMGYYADKSTGRGQLYLVTRDEEPFCANQFQIEIYNSDNNLPLKTIGKLEATLEGEGGLNETFLITDKEDAEFFAGDVISRIIVLHPALGFPTSLTLQYKSYSGWLSKGLTHWDIDKVVLTDSFGQSYSLCQPSTSLTSGIPVYMMLQPNVCEIPKLDDLTTTSKSPFDDTITQSGQDRLDEDDGIETVKQKKDIYNLGNSYKFDQNQSFSLQNDKNSIKWQPIFEGNSLDKDVSESSRSLNSDVLEIFEPVLKTQNFLNTGRDLHEIDKTEIVEPILKSTTPKIRRVKEVPLNDLEKEKNRVHKNKPVTVQLFPFRLGEFLERAERYARETILPIISEKAPRIFGIGWNRKDYFDRKPRYIPLFEEIEINNSNANSSSETTNLTKSIEKPEDITVSESQQYKNILEILRESNKKNMKGEQSALSELFYYANKKNNTWNFDSNSSLNIDEKGVLREIYIDLPTYRPSTKNFPNSPSKMESIISKTPSKSPK